MTHLYPLIRIFKRFWCPKWKFGQKKAGPSEPFLTWVCSKRILNQFFKISFLDFYSLAPFSSQKRYKKGERGVGCKKETPFISCQENAEMKKTYSSRFRSNYIVLQNALSFAAKPLFWKTLAHLCNCSVHQKFTAALFI